MSEGMTSETAARIAFNLLRAIREENGGDVNPEIEGPLLIAAAVVFAGDYIERALVEVSS